MRIPPGSSVHLENLIETYSAAIFGLPFGSREIDKLAWAVDREAERIGYQGHARIAALHLAREQMDSAVADSTL